MQRQFVFKSIPVPHVMFPTELNCQLRAPSSVNISENLLPCCHFHQGPAKHNHGQYLDLKAATCDTFNESAVYNKLTLTHSQTLCFVRPSKSTRY